MPKVKRQRLDFVPQFDGAISGWAVNYIKRNYWRVASRHEFEDLIQEAWIIFDKVRDNYPHVNNAPQFFCLFRTAFTNHIHDLAINSTSERNLVVDISEEDLSYEDILANIMGDCPNAGFANVLFKQAPRELKLLLRSMFDDAKRDLFLQKMKRRDPGHRLSERETTNQYWCRIVGLDPNKVDLVDLLHEHFGEAA